jgi:hypothetical protein
MRDEDRKFRVTYCEDVRIEVTGQMSIIGIFMDAIRFPVFPATLPKFCFFIEVGTPVERLFKHLHFSVYTESGLKIIDQEVPHDILSQQEAALPNIEFDEEGPKLLSLRMNLMATGVTFDEPTVIRSKLTTELGEVKGQSLRVRPGTMLVPQLSGA